MVIGFIGEEFWTHVVRGPYECAGHIVLVLQHSCNAEVSNFNDVGLCQEDILCFKVAMKNVPLMQVLKARITMFSSKKELFDLTWTPNILTTYLECHGNLYKPLHHLPFRQEFPFLLFESVIQVATFTETHHNVQL